MKYFFSSLPNPITKQQVEYWFIPFILYLVVPSVLLSINAFQVGETVTCLCQFLYTLYLVFSNINQPSYRNNPLMTGAWFYFLYLSIGPLVIIFEIGTSYTGESFLHNVGIDYRSMLITQLLLNILGIVTWYLGLWVNSRIEIQLATGIEHILKYSRYYTYASVLGVGLQIYLFWSGQVFLGGFDTTQGLTVFTSLGPIFLSCIPLIGGVLIQKKYYQITWLLILLIQLMWLVFFGKFRLIVAVYLFSVTYFNQQTLWSKANLYKILALSILLFGAGNLYQLFHFYDLNTALRHRSDRTAWQRFSSDFKLNERYTQKQNVYFTYRIQTSHLPIARMVYLYHQGQLKPLGGEDLVGNVKNSTPANLVYDKKKLLLDEALYEKRFGSIFPFPDIGNTIVLQGLVDFWIGGVLGYMGIYYGIWGLLFFYVVQQSKIPLLKILFFVLITQQIWSNIESTMGNALVQARNFLFIVFLCRLSFLLYQRIIQLSANQAKL
ncbi:MAG: hypothetical protein U0Y10_27620 [Spirosomataceae bacterium]